MIAAVILLAQDVAAAPWYDSLLDNTLALMLLLIFLAAVIATFVGARSRDRCLKKFAGFDVTILEQAGRAIWGRLRVFSNGLEVLFRDPAAEADAPLKQSFLIYQPELSRLLLVARYVDELRDPAQARRRVRQLRTMAHPGPLTRLRRWARNLVNTFRDAIVKALGLAVSQAQKTAKAPVMQVGGGQITEVGALLVGQAGNAYEPMLEQYFGRQVVAEIINPADPARKVVEYAGYLGEYSAAHILLVDCLHTEEGRFLVPPDGHLLLDQHLRADLSGRTLTVRHAGHFPAAVTRVAWGSHDQKLNVELAPAAASDASPGVTAIELEDPPGPADTLSVFVRLTRRLDLIAPRTVAVVRHRSAFPVAPRP